MSAGSSRAATIHQMLSSSSQRSALLASLSLPLQLSRLSTAVDHSPAHPTASACRGRTTRAPTCPPIPLTSSLLSQCHSSDSAAAVASASSTLDSASSSRLASGRHRLRLRRRQSEEETADLSFALSARDAFQRVAHGTRAPLPQPIPLAPLSGADMLRMRDGEGQSATQCGDSAAVFSAFRGCAWRCESGCSTQEWRSGAGAGDG